MGSGYSRNWYGWIFGYDAIFVCACRRFYIRVEEGRPRMGLVIPFEHFAWLRQLRFAVHGLYLTDLMSSACFLAMHHVEMEPAR